MISSGGGGAALQASVASSTILRTSASISPIVFSETPVKDYRAPPLLGENTREVLATIGYDDARMDALKKEKII